jgi:hypothetical protein
MTTGRKVCKQASLSGHIWHVLSLWNSTAQTTICSWSITNQKRRIVRGESFDLPPFGIQIHKESSSLSVSPWFPQRLQVQKEEFRYFDRFGQSTDWIPLNLCNKKVENRNIRMVCYFTQYSVTRQLKTETWMLCHFTQYSATNKFISHLAIFYGIGGPK